MQHNFNFWLFLCLVGIPTVSYFIKEYIDNERWNDIDLRFNEVKGIINSSIDPYIGYMSFNNELVNTTDKIVDTDALIVLIRRMQTEIKDNPEHMISALKSKVVCNYILNLKA